MSNKNPRKITPDAYVESGRHLPVCLRSHSDAANVFRAIHGLVDFSRGAYGLRTNSTEGHCYVIDIFLWFMAKRGYTLQKSRANVDFRDLEDDVNGYVMVARNAFYSALKAELDKNKGGAS